MRGFFLFSFFLFSTIAVTGQESKAERIELLNKQLRTFVDQQKFVEALAAGTELIDLNASAYGAESERMAVVYGNVGFIQRQLERYEPAKLNLVKALEIRSKLSLADAVERIRLMETLAACQEKTGDQGGANLTYKTAIGLLDNSSLKGTKYSFYLLLSAANNAATLKNFDAANELYLRVLRLSYEHFDIDSSERENLLIYRTCLLSNTTRNSKETKSYRDENERLKKEEEATKGIVNGKAITLGRPAYPASAKAKRLGGTVYVRVRIDPEGRVVNAAPICSDPELGAAGVAAAKNSRFSPTSKNGQPISIYGLVTYNFVAPY